MALRESIIETIECLEKVLDVVNINDPEALGELKERLQEIKAATLDPIPNDARKKRWDNVESRQKQRAIQKERWKWVNSHVPFTLTYGGKTETILGWEKLSKAVGLPVDNLKARINRGAGWIELQEENFEMNLKHETDMPFRTVCIEKGKNPKWEGRKNV